MYNFNLETIDESLREDLEPLLYLNWQEVDNKLLLNPDWQTYYSVQSTNLIRCYTARVDDVLVGYSIFFISPSLHHKDYRIAHNDVFYIHPECRAGKLPYKFLNYFLQQIKDEGISLITINTKVQKDFHKLLEYFGFEFSEYSYTRVLEY